MATTGVDATPAAAAEYHKNDENDPAEGARG